MRWQQALLEHLRRVGPEVRAVRPYGSVTDPARLDRWSDLDAEVDLTVDIDAQRLLGRDPWAWQDVTGDGLQRVRVVLPDGRRADLVLRGGTVRFPEPPVDNAVRFDLALAATRFGRGADVIGLHLTLGVVRRALVDTMVLADRQSGTDHHRSRTVVDDAAAEALALLSTDLSPGLTMRVAEFSAARRALVDGDYRPDWSGLTAIVATPVSSDS